MTSPKHPAYVPLSDLSPATREKTVELSILAHEKVVTLIHEVMAVAAEKELPAVISMQILGHCLMVHSIGFFLFLQSDGMHEDTRLSREQALSLIRKNVEDNITSILDVADAPGRETLN